jgi:cytochrome c-type biogenesis protein
MVHEISLILVFTAGLLSFFSPCILPLIPSYLSLMGGMSPDSILGRPRLIAGTVSFILGFSAVFITLSLLSSVVFTVLGGVSRYLNLAAGGIVILLGLNVIFDFFSFLNYEKRYHIKRRPRSIAGVFAAGMAFGAGWTPCIGPILTGILLLAGQPGETAKAALYLGVYSFGLGLPFLAAAFFFDRFLIRAERLRFCLPLIRRIIGVLLIHIGILILTGRFSALNIVIQKFQYRYIDWAEDKALPFRIFAHWLTWIQEL